MLSHTCVAVTGLITIVLSLLAVAFFSVFERNVLGVLQLRLGPGKTLLMGVSQPIADAVKLLTNQESSVKSSSGSLFYLSPAIMMVVSLIMWALYPHAGGYSSWESGVLLLLLLLSSSVYGVIVLGWFSNSKYACLGAARAAVQSISYEVGLAITIVFLCLCYSSYELIGWSQPQRDCWSVVWIPLVWGVFLTISLVEGNRSPFDLSEGESELVSGFCVEYGGSGYTIVFLSENLALLWSLLITSLAFFGGSMISLSFLLLLVVWVRGCMPRIRFDSLMNFFWSKVFPFLFPLFGSYLSLL